MPAFRKPRLASHYYVRTEPPDERGDEVMHFTSETRRVKLKGHSFREFQQHVIPLLDGVHTVDDIAAAVADVFAPDDLAAGLGLLAEQHLLEDAAREDAPAPGRADTIRPQHNLLLDLGVDPLSVHERLREATVSVVGLAGAGATTAAALAASGVGTVRLVDAGAVSAADPYLAPAYTSADVGAPRIAALARHLAAARPDARIAGLGGPFDSDAQVRDAIDGSDFVVCAVDAGQSGLIYRLNRVCLAAGVRWMAVAPAAVEIVVGPLVDPYETACYMCYRMRLVACAEAPEEEFAFQSLLDRRRHDDSATRENLVFGTTIAGQLAALEAFKILSGAMAPSTHGAVVVFDLLNLATTRHVVLRKPWCPACHARPDAPGQAGPR